MAVITWAASSLDRRRRDLPVRSNTDSSARPGRRFRAARRFGQSEIASPEVSSLVPVQALGGRESCNLPSSGRPRCGRASWTSCLNLT